MLENPAENKVKIRDRREKRNEIRNAKTITFTFMRVV